MQDWHWPLWNRTEQSTHTVYWIDPVREIHSLQQLKMKVKERRANTLEDCTHTNWNQTHLHTGCFGVKRINIQMCSSVNVVLFLINKDDDYGSDKELQSTWMQTMFVSEVMLISCGVLCDLYVWWCQTFQTWTGGNGRRESACSNSHNVLDWQFNTLTPCKSSSINLLGSNVSAETWHFPSHHH